ncbi:MAG TPA: two-component regulator propeller domain-containing protein, partial [Arenimonas sp.]|nr:two-component regulator propeller domain-containing protein [Arenimonas sp.]
MALLPAQLLCAQTLSTEPPVVEERLRFHRLPVSGALLQNTVSAIMQDRNGLLWFGTLGGLQIYDGYQFRPVSTEPDAPDALSGVFVSRLFEDRDGYIWVAGQLGWLDRLDPRTGQLRRFPRTLFGPEGAPAAGLSAFAQGDDGAIWIGTSGGLHRFLPDFDELQVNVDARADREPVLAIRDLHLAADGRLWLATSTGLYRYDPSSGEREHFRHDPDDPTSLGSDTLTALQLDPDGTLWVGSNLGLHRWRGEGRGFERFRHDPADPSSLGGDQVNVIRRDSHGRLWIGSQSGGLSLWQNGNFLVSRHDPDDPESLAVDDVWTLFEDRAGLLWIGTAGAGLHQINPYRHAFHALRSIPFNSNSLRSAFVWDLAEDARGDVWMATLAGIERYRPRDGSFRLYQPRPGEVAANQMQSLHIDPQGRIWAGAVDGHLYRLDPRAGSFHAIADPARGDGFFSGPRVWYIGDGDASQLWIGTANDLLRLDADRGEIIERLSQSAGLDLAGNAVRIVLHDSDGVMWFGGGAGLSRYLPQQRRVETLRRIPGDTRSLSHDAVRTLREDAEGRLWVGTQNGLNRMSAQDRRAGRNRFVRFGRGNGLPDSTIYGIVPDPQDGFWISTNAGLSHLRSNGAIRNYDWRDGLPGSEMNGGAELVARDGRLYFGGVAGVTWFDPRALPRNTQVPEVRISRVSV